MFFHCRTLSSRSLGFGVPFSQPPYLYDTLLVIRRLRVRVEEGSPHCALMPRWVGESTEGRVALKKTSLLAHLSFCSICSEDLRSASIFSHAEDRTAPKDRPTNVGQEAPTSTEQSSGLRWAGLGF